MTAATDPVCILVMGLTGSGKSSFIKLASGTEDDIEGSGLDGCTQSVKEYLFTLDGRDIVLVDTPGFDDGLRKDVDILQDVCGYLSQKYYHGKLLSGILYLHPILEPRMKGSSRRNLEVFQGLCGKDSLSNVILVTTFWDIVNTEAGAAREGELVERQDFWGSMMARGSRVERHDNSSESATQIIRKIVKEEPAALAVQRQIVDEGHSLEQTDAGQVLDREITKLRDQYEERIANLRGQRDVLLAERSGNDLRIKELLTEKTELEQAQLVLRRDIKTPSTKKAAPLSKSSFQIASFAILTTGIFLLLFWVAYEREKASYREQFQQEQFEKAWTEREKIYRSQNALQPRSSLQSDMFKRVAWKAAEIGGTMLVTNVVGMAAGTLLGIVDAPSWLRSWMGSSSNSRQISSGPLNLQVNNIMGSDLPNFKHLAPGGYQ